MLHFGGNVQGKNALYGLYRAAFTGEKVRVYRSVDMRRLHCSASRDALYGVYRAAVTGKEVCV